MMLQWLQQEKETCGSEWFQGYLGSAQENKGTLTVQEEFGGAITLTLEEHSQAENSGPLVCPPLPSTAGTYLT